MLLLQLGVFAHFYRYPYLFFLQFHFTLREEWSSHTKRQNRLLTRLVGTTNALRFSGLAIYCTFAGFVGRVYFRQHGAGQLSCAGDATARHCDVFRDEICIYLGHSYKRWSVLVGRGGRARKEEFKTFNPMIKFALTKATIITVVNRQRTFYLAARLCLPVVRLSLLSTT